jgi:hypothetical protein
LKHELEATISAVPMESLHSPTKSNTDMIVDLSPEECAQALTHFMAKSHEEKLNALKHLKENKDSVIKVSCTMDSTILTILLNPFVNP